MKIAVIGSGISGLGAAYILSHQHEVHVFEASNRLGGHAHTVHLPVDGQLVPMDTGFLVFNDLTYPHLIALFKHLQVETIESDMTLSIRMDDKKLEWCGTNLNTVYGQRTNLFKLRFHFMLLEILRFHREANDNLLLARRHGWTLAELLNERKFSKNFCESYLLPMAAAIWSTPETGMLEFPASTFLTFLINHKLVQVNDRPKWSTVRNGSIEYVKKLALHLKNIHLNSPVQIVERRAGKIYVKAGAHEGVFDKVVMATHAPVTAKILKMTEAESKIMSVFRTEANRSVLHQDASFMPRQKRCWAAWNVFGAKTSRQNKVSLSYHLNRLQPLGTQRNFFLTLNPQNPVADAAGEFSYEHPRFDHAAIRAQGLLSEIQGTSGVYFAGAWTRYGFHEDGLLSAVNVAELLQCPIPWKVK